MATHEQTERLIKAMDLDLDYRQEIPLGEISRTEHSQNRQTDQDRSVVEDYAAAYARGDEMPALMLWAGHDGTASPLIIIDGNTRYAALMSLKPRERPATVDGYVVTCNKQQFETLTLTCNAPNGNRPPAPWLVTQAIQLVDMGYTQAQAAAMAKVAPQNLSRRLKLRDAERRAERLQIMTPWKRLTEAHVLKVANVADDSAFVETVCMAALSGLTSGETGNIVNTVAKIGSETDRLAYLAEQREALRGAADAPAPKPGLSLAAKLTRRLHELLQTDIAATIASASESERDNLRSAAAQVSTMLEQLQ